jgi:hypothetical protein
MSGVGFPRYLRVVLQRAAHFRKAPEQASEGSLELGKLVDLVLATRQRCLPIVVQVRWGQFSPQNVWTT